MQTNLHLVRPTLSAFLSFLLVVCLPYLVLTFAAPRARGELLFFAFPLWSLGLRPADRMADRLLSTLHGAKPRKAPRELRDLA